MGDGKSREGGRRPSANIVPDQKLDSVIAAVMTYLVDHLTITNRELRALTGVDYDQAIWFFNRMVKEQKLVREGIASGTRYRLPTPTPTPS